MILILFVMTLFSPIVFVFGVMHLIDRIRYGKNHNKGSFIGDVFYVYLLISVVVVILLVI